MLRKSGVLLVTLATLVLMVFAWVGLGASPAYAGSPVVFYNGLAFNIPGYPGPCGGWSGSGQIETQSYCSDMILDVNEWMRKHLDYRTDTRGETLDYMKWDFSLYVPQAIGNSTIQAAYQFQVAVFESQTAKWSHCNATYNSSYPGYFSCTIPLTYKGNYDYIQVKLERIWPYASHQLHVEKMYAQYTMIVGPTPTFTARASAVPTATTRPTVPPP